MEVFFILVDIKLLFPGISGIGFDPIKRSNETIIINREKSTN
jgi:hypothetical protein